VKIKARFPQSCNLGATSFRTTSFDETQAKHRCPWLLGWSSTTGSPRRVDAPIHKRNEPERSALKKETDGHRRIFLLKDLKGSPHTVVDLGPIFDLRHQKKGRACFTG
jgi:hypothetical protein